MERVTITLKKPAVSKLGVFLKSEQDGSTPTVVTSPGGVLGPAGLKEDDLIVTIQGQTIEGAVHGCTLLSKTAVGSDIEIVVDRAAVGSPAVVAAAVAAPVAVAAPPAERRPSESSDVLTPLPIQDAKAPAPAPTEEDNIFSAVGNWVGMISNRIQGNA